MSIEANKAIARRFIEEIYGQHHLDLIDEIAAPEYVTHEPSGEAVPGKEHNLKRTITGYRTAFPDLHVTVEQILGEGNMVAVQWTANGTHQQSLPHLGSEFAVPAENTSVTVSGMSLFRFGDGKIQEVWNHWDTHHLMQQIRTV